MLIIEGPDLVGKTHLARRAVTMANEILESTGYRSRAIYSHFSRLPRGWDFFHSYLDYVNMWTVQDRFHMSEPVYAACTGRDVRPTPEEYRLLDARLRDVGSLTVVIVAAPSYMRRLVAERARDEMYDDSVIIEANRRYSMLCGLCEPTPCVEDEAVVSIQPDVDYVVVLDDSEPRVTDEIALDIVRAWTSRAREVCDIKARALDELLRGIGGGR